MSAGLQILIIHSYIDFFFIDIVRPVASARVVPGDIKVLIQHQVSPFRFKSFEGLF